MSYIKNLLSSSEEIETTLKSILKETPEVSFSNFFEGFGLKTYVKAPGFYSSAYIKEKWAKRVYNNPEKIDEANTNVTQILDQFLS